MKLAGIDVSTFAVDIVTVPYEDGGDPEWHRFPLTGKDAFDRTRSVANAMPGRSSVFWDDILAVGIEHPAGRHGVGPLLRVQGAVLAQIPARMLVEPFPPGKWRKAVGLPGNCSKGAIRSFAAERHTHGWTEIRGFSQDSRWQYESASNATALMWPQDACDAYCIALATRQAITTEKAA